ncbi:MAG: hypothetical protein JWN04_2204 [Myxococcaceae bacterium]|nr:hypothetical protein [Myxococcaceae bacterium]
MLTVALRLPALGYPWPIDDEKVYAVVANEMLAGALPYRDAIERKPPLLFWIYEAVFSIAGKVDFTLLHFVGLLWALTTMVGLYVGARSCFERETGVAAAMLYGIYMAAAEYKNLAVNGELLMNLPLVWAWALILQRELRFRAVAIYAAGALLTCAALIKQPAGAGAIAIGLYILLPSYRRTHKLSLTRQLAQASILVLGALSALLIVLSVLEHQGILNEAIYWSIGDHDIPHGMRDPIFWKRAWGGGAWFFASCAPLTLLVALALRGGWGPRGWFAGTRTELHGLTLLLACSTLGAAASGRFYTHYFLQLLPAMAWLGAAVLVGMRHQPDRYASRLLSANALQIGIFLTAITFVAVDAHALSRDRDGGATASYIETHSSETDRIFVWGQTSGFYLRAHRRPASRYIAVFPLTGYIFGSPLGLDPNYDTSERILPGAWDQLAADLALHPPLFIVDSDSTGPHPKYDPFAYPMLGTLLRQHYEVSFRSSDGIAYRRVR